MVASELFPGVSAAPVCVFCASSPGHDPIYLAAARSVGESLAKAKIPVVYGGGIRGLMGAVASSALSIPTSNVHGILPRALSGRAAESTLAKVDPGAEVRNRAMVKSLGSGGERDVEAGGEGGKSKEGSGDVFVGDNGDEGVLGKFTTETVETMHERKLRMADLSTGGFLVLPGGFGTFEEAFEMTTWNQLKIHQRPVVVLNVNNFYTPLSQMISNAVSAGFITPLNSTLIKIVSLEEGEVESEVDWGQKGLEALRTWKWEDGAGYDLKWEKKSE